MPGVVVVVVIAAGVTVVVEVLGLGGLAVLAAVAFEQPAFGLPAAADLGVEQVEHALVEAEVAAQREGDLRVLAAQAGHLGAGVVDDAGGAGGAAGQLEHDVRE